MKYAKEGLNELISLIQLSTYTDASVQDSCAGSIGSALKILTEEMYFFSPVAINCNESYSFSSAQYIFILVLREKCKNPEMGKNKPLMQGLHNTNNIKESQKKWRRVWDSNPRKLPL